MAIDPISLTAIGLMVLGRIFSGKEKEDAQRGLSAAASDYRSALASLNYNRDRMLKSVNLLSSRRLGYTRYLINDLIGLAKQLPNRRRIFDPDQGWFAGKGVNDINAMVAAAKKVYTPYSKLGDELTAVGFGVVAIQGLEALDKIGLVHVPFLSESLHDVVANLPIDGADHAASFLDAGGATVGDALGVIGLAWGAYRVVSNLGKASSMRGDAANLRSATHDANVYSYRFKTIHERGGYINDGLEGASYDAFKWGWIGQRVLVGPTANPSTSVYQRTIQKLEAATRKFWAFLNIPLLDAHGSASSVELPQYQPTQAAA